MRFKNSFLVVGTQRTGSSALANSLNTHPNISCGWEWTQKSSVLNKIAVAEEALSGDFRVLDRRHQKMLEGSVSASTAWLGFRRLFRSTNRWLIHPRWSPANLVDQFEAHIRWLSKSRQDIRVIHIVRRDNVEWIKSKELAKASQAFHSASYEDIRVQVDVKEAGKRILAKDWIDRKLASLQDTNKYICLHYEDFEKNNRRETEKAVSFLECDASLLETEQMFLQKQSTKPVDQYIENIDELIKALESENLRFSSL
jgi:hypothetical protein